MPGLIKKFVVAKRDRLSPQGVVVEKGDVGVVLAKSTAHASVFFIRPWKRVEMRLDDLGSITISRVGDAYPKKICNVCHKLKKTTEFAKNQNAKNNRSVRRPSCQTCRLSIDGRSIPRSERTAWLKKKPIAEPFECPICKKRTIAGVTSKVVLEHSHLTGAVGGWICDSCNTGLGRFKDDPELLKSAIQFLKKNY